jgi:hypothetical protein
MNTFDIDLSYDGFSFSLLHYASSRHVLYVSGMGMHAYIQNPQSTQEELLSCFEKCVHPSDLIATIPNPMPHY